MNQEDILDLGHRATIRKMVWIVGLSTLCSLLSALPLRAASYYVAPSGSDSSAGTLANPFRTITHGVSVLAPGDTLNIRGGTYVETLDYNTPIPSGSSWSNAITL